MGHQYYINMYVYVIASKIESSTCSAAGDRRACASVECRGENALLRLSCGDFSPIVSGDNSRMPIGDLSRMPIGDLSSTLMGEMALLGGRGMGECSW